MRKLDVEYCNYQNSINKDFMLIFCILKVKVNYAELESLDRGWDIACEPSTDLRMLLVRAVPSGTDMR